MGNDRLPRHSGFSLIEILVSIIIITVGMFAVLTLITMVIKANAHSRRSTEATTIVQNRMEDVVGLNYGSVTTSNATAFPSGTYTSSTHHVLKMVVEDDVPDVNTKTVKLHVYWNPATSTSSHSVELMTVIAR